jgi:hypothetical protein
VCERESVRVFENVCECVDERESAKECLRMHIRDERECKRVRKKTSVCVCV